MAENYFPFFVLNRIYSLSLLRLGYDKHFAKGAHKRQAFTVFKVEANNHSQAYI